MNIDKQITIFKRKMYLNSIVNSILYGLINSFILSTILIIILYIFRVKNNLITLTCFGSLFVIFTLISYFKFFKVTKESTARTLDKLGLDERVITMIEFKDEDSDYIILQREDTLKRLKNVSVKEIKVKIQKFSLLILCFSLLIFTGLFFLPNPKISGEPIIPGTGDTEESEEDLIIKEMLEKVRQIINDSLIDQELKEKLHEMVDKLEEDLNECTTTNQKITLIKKVMKEIQDIIDYYLTERNIGQALQMYDPFTNEAFLTGPLGVAVEEKDLDGVDSSLEDFKQLILAASRQRNTTFEELRDIYADNLDEALKRATLEDNEALIAAITNFRDALKEATPENIEEIIEVAKEEIKKALMEDPSGTKEDQAVEDTKEEITDVMQDAIDQLEKEEQEEEDEIETEGEDENEDQQESPAPVPEEPLDSEPIIDGETPYLPEYDKYADIINQILSSYEGEEIPDDLKKIIEEYLKMLK